VIGGRGGGDGCDGRWRAKRVSGVGRGKILVRCVRKDGFNLEGG